jgi:protocatechuate 3,4-dioxygenase beta subunit
MCTNCNRVCSSRREVMRSGALAFIGAATTGAAIVRAATPVATPSETEGPFWEDELLNRSDVRTDPSTGVAQLGLPLYLTVSLSRLANGTAAPVANAWVDIWHANYQGYYSDEPAGMGNINTLGQKWLRGYQVTDGHGIVRFTTIYPGFYTGRTTHIHARVRTYNGSTQTLNFTTQFFFDDTISDKIFSTVAPYSARGGLANRTRNSNDNVYNTVSTGSTAASPDGKRLMLRLSGKTVHATASFNIILA